MIAQPNPVLLAQCMDAAGEVFANPPARKVLARKAPFRKVPAVEIKTVPFADVAEYYARRQPTGHWFNKEILQLFRTRLPSVAYETPAGVLFITSDCSFDRARQYYNVRRQTVDGDIKTIGRYNDHRTRAEAMNFLKRVAAGAAS
jgi:hypothetical protein